MHYTCIYVSHISNYWWKNLTLYQPNQSKLSKSRSQMYVLVEDFRRIESVSCDYKEHAIYKNRNIDLRLPHKSEDYYRDLDLYINIQS